MLAVKPDQPQSLSHRHHLSPSQPRKNPGSVYFMLQSMLFIFQKQMKALNAIASWKAIC
uniref:Uncharacterized protein n=1 Tax=Anguilla anguilla TaxID=7936 RepID=A0A0E9WVE1_ANGAN